MAGKDKYNAIIIGAGLGGLAAAAFLAKAGLKTVIFEKTPYIGGRCRSCWFGNSKFGKYPFDVGPIFSGTNLIKLLKERLGEEPAFKITPVKILIFSKGKYLTTIPPGRHILKDLRQMGASFSEAIYSSYKLWRQRRLESYSHMDSHNDIAHFLTKNQLMRNILNMRAGLFHGCLPDDMPGYTFNNKDYGKPFYPIGGMQKIPDTLVSIIKKHGGQIHTAIPVSQILMEDGKAVGVLAEGECIKSDFVISGISVAQTVLELCKGARFTFAFLDQVRSFKQGLQASMVFMIIDRKKIDIPQGNLLYISLPPLDLNETMHQLFNGIYPDDPPFGLFVTEGIPQQRFETATLIFYAPKGEVKRDRIVREGEQLVKKTNLFIPGFRDSILWQKTVTSLDYPAQIGFRSSVLPVAESKTYRKLPFPLPIKNLFNVGSSVLPSGGGTVQAVKSGLECGEFILISIKKEGYYGF
ncbi:MAG TPA: NAD(P)/FAD-dependent oxidoreductase [Syntrophaceae bacterium]|nr:NAD(P)/FAD-dependent oxidoreductase [Syntrophaceae bacterium]